jgi:hypothetical protein
MGHKIINRYFQSNYHVSEESMYVNEAVNTCILRLKNYKKEYGKAFSFCGTVIKNEFNTQFITYRKSYNSKEYRNAITNNNLDVITIREDKKPKSYQPDIELISVQEEVLDKLYEMWEYYKQKEYEATKRRQQGKTGKFMGITTRLETLEAMIDVLETKEFSTYERFIFDVQEKMGVSVESFIRRFESLGFSKKGIYGVLRYRELAPDENYRDSDWTLDDYPVSEREAVTERKNKKKRRRNM